MTTHAPAELGVREANYCFPHFLDAATLHYYPAARALSQSLLSSAERLREDELAAQRKSAPARRVQPPRGVKRKLATTDQEPGRCAPSLRPVVERKIKGLVSGMPVRRDARGEGGVMGVAGWRAELRELAQREVTRKVLEKYRRVGKGAERCVFGRAAWKCRVCEEEERRRGGRPEAEPRVVREEGPLPPGPMSEVAVMSGPVETEDLETGDWWGVDIPRGEVVKFGGLRFVVHVCGHTLMMFV